MSDESLDFKFETDSKTDVPSPYDDPMVLLIEDESSISEASL
jgi:hypothetical protein